MVTWTIILVTCLLQLIFREKWKFCTFIIAATYISKSGSLLLSTSSPERLLLISEGANICNSVEETDACGWCCRQQAGRASMWFTVSKTSPAAASAPLGFQPFIPGQNKRGLCVRGTIGVVAKVSSIGRGNYCLIFFFNSKKFSCNHSVAVRQVLWL